MKIFATRPKLFMSMLLGTKFGLPPAAAGAPPRPEVACLGAAVRGSRNFTTSSMVNGEGFEVARTGELVWRYLNPLTDARGARDVLRIERYSPEFVEPLLARSRGR